MSKIDIITNQTRPQPSFRRERVLYYNRNARVEACSVAVFHGDFERGAGRIRRLFLHASYAA
ncbi:MAG: hypothetical protein K2O94_02530 [Clostridiales bacterium]|uniref:hypothetical protein n=1 Tax=Anaerocaecibacter muris TaxID=2941513 RepID=UPI00203D7A49|nr:hypothetical protein [Anaerocaecibacter muris]MDE6965836.1 hypothetical protein [Clostridiales bacterium]